MLKQILMAAVMAGVTLVSANAVRAETRVTGAGATFPKPLYLKWVGEVNKKDASTQFDYTGGGSGVGKKSLLDKTAQFAGSDAPLTAKETKGYSSPVLHLPTVAGPVVMTYNVPGVSKLTLDGNTIAGIYIGDIKTWNDPAIAKLNPDVSLPGKNIVVARRSDGSGTSFIFTQFLSSVSKPWAENVGAATEVQWPVGDGYKGNDGVAGAVKATEGAIGYVELGYAAANKLPYATMINKDGKAVEASVDTVVNAASNLKEVPANLVLNINNASGEKSYPIAGFTYILVYEDLKDGGMSKEQATALVGFLKWSLTDGQAMAAPDYAKLPEAIQSKVLEKLKTIKYGGETLIK